VFEFEFEVAILKNSKNLLHVVICKTHVLFMLTDVFLYKNYSKETGYK
jgi:hypothetical protein